MFGQDELRAIRLGQLKQICESQSKSKDGFKFI
jgi:hypothetical protein